MFENRWQLYKAGIYVNLSSGRKPGAYYFYVNLLFVQGMLYSAGALRSVCGFGVSISVCAAAAESLLATKLCPLWL